MAQSQAWRMITCVAFVLSSLVTLTAFAQSGDGSSRENPIALNGVGEVGDYQISVIDVIPDATEIIAAENQFNEAPAIGNQFFMARVAVTYTGSETGTPWIDLNFQAVGASNVGYSEYDNSCGVIPDDGASVSELFEGGSVEFNVCWQVSTDDTPSLAMYIDELMSFDSVPVWFSLGGDQSAIATPESGGLKTAGETTEVVPESSRNEPIPVGSTGKSAIITSPSPRSYQKPTM